MTSHKKSKPFITRTTGTDGLSINEPMLPFDKRKQAGRTNIQESMTVTQFKRAVARENVLQGQVEELLKVKYPDVRYIRFPDWVYARLARDKDPILRAIAKILRGVPDLIIFKEDDRFNQALLLELKAKQGSLRQGQKNWSKNLNLHIKRDFESVEKLLEEFMG